MKKFIYRKETNDAIHEALDPFIQKIPSTDKKAINDNIDKLFNKVRGELRLLVDGVHPLYEQQLEQELEEYLRDSTMAPVLPSKFIGPIEPFWVHELRVRQRLYPYQTTGMLMLFLKQYNHKYMTKNSN
jgi:hypothetical protein